MLAVQSGDLEKLGDLFERHHAGIYSFCLRLTGKAAAAEDLTQETFLRALRYSRTFRGTSGFLPWLYRVARNVTNDRFRRKRLPEHGVEELLTSILCPGSSASPAWIAASFEQGRPRLSA